MIPPAIAPDCRSDGEREVFRRLRDDPETADWTVLHSLALAKHEKRVEGEVDFVVIIPSRGVLCVEVKGCSSANLRRENGLWFYGPGDKGSPRSPFQQVSEAMHSLQKQIVRRDRTLATVQFSCGVIFPFAPFSARSVEWHDWQVIDSRAFRSMSIGRLMVRVMDAGRIHLKSAQHAPLLIDGVPTTQQCRLISDSLRPNFEIPICPQVRARQLDGQLLQYTSDQMIALDAMEGNQRTIFTGPAGTGKTLLAIEVARRACASGRRTLLVCYNRLLGAWLEQKLVAFRPLVEAGTLHRQMLKISAADPRDADPEFWESTLPDLACEHLLGARNGTPVYDELVVDEAQDILRGPYLDFLDLSLAGGLGAGSWRMFGDFENASIYGSANMSLEQFRRERSGNASVFALRVNCRNTPLIAEYVHLLGGLEPPYLKVLRPDDGITPELHFYNEHENRPLRLGEIIKSVGRLGFEPNEIVVLSPFSEKSSAALLSSVPPWRGRLRPLADRDVECITYGSIHSFKGLEAPVVVVTDIDTIATPSAQSLLYVAVTRALQRLVVLASECVRGELSHYLRRLAGRSADVASGQ